MIIKLEQVGEERDGARFNVVFEKTRGFYGKDAETFEARLLHRGRRRYCLVYFELRRQRRVQCLRRNAKEKVPVEKAAKDLKITPCHGLPLESQGDRQRNR